MSENPFEPITHTVKITLQRCIWDDLLKPMEQGYHDSIRETIGSKLYKLWELEIILEKDDEFKQIWEAWLEEWSARRREAEDALAESYMLPDYDFGEYDPY